MAKAERLDLIAIGRSCVDLYGEQTGGRLEDMLSFAKYIGGSPTNTAVGASRLGLRTGLLTRVGEDHFGRFIREQLVREGVDTRGVVPDPERLTALAFLGIRDPDTALDAAARWCDLAENHDDLSAALADPRYIGAPEGIIRRVLAGEFSIDSQGNRRVIDNYFIFHGGHANYPRQSQALWIYSQMIRWGQAEFSPAGVEAALSAYRPDIYRAALGDANAPDDADIRIEGQEEQEDQPEPQAHEMSSGHPLAAST